MADLISIIVPVYNVEKYLDQCIESIINQTYKELEIFLIEDGSPDNCGAICDSWAKKDDRIKVFHVDNGGSARARNIGLLHAKGKYVGFVDADDFLMPSMYEILYKLAINSSAEITECGYYKVTSDVMHNSLNNLEGKTIRTFNTAEALLENVRDTVVQQVVWNKLYLKRIIGNTFFTEGKYIDDEFWTYKIIGSAKKIVSTTEKLYCYRQQEASMMHQSFSLRRMDALEAKLQRLKYLEQRFPSIVSEAKCNLYFTCIYLQQMALKDVNKKEQIVMKKKIKNCLNSFCMEKSDLKCIDNKQRIWFWVSRLSFIGTCRIRNILKIGF